MTDTKLGTFAELLQLTEDSQRETAVRLREIILAIDPNACEVVRLGEKAATYGVGPKKMSNGYSYILLHKSWVNFGFFRGIDLPNPHGLLEGTGKMLRHIKVRSLEDAENPKIHALIEVALAERTQAISA